MTPKIPTVQTLSDLFDEEEAKARDAASTPEAQAADQAALERRRQAIEALPDEDPSDDLDDDFDTEDGDYDADDEDGEFEDEGSD